MHMHVHMGLLLIMYEVSQIAILTMGTMIYVLNTYTYTTHIQNQASHGCNIARPQVYQNVTTTFLSQGWSLCNL